MTRRPRWAAAAGKQLLFPAGPVAAIAFSSEKPGLLTALCGRVREPLLIPLAAVASGIALSRWAEPERGELAAALAASFSLALVAARLRARIGGWIALCATMLLLGALAERVHRPGPPPTIAASARETVVIEGCVAEPPVAEPGRHTFRAELAEGAHALVRVARRDGDEPLALAYGQRVDITGRIRVPRNYRNPGAFDYEGYLARKQIYWTISVSGPEDVAVLPGRCGSRLRGFVYGIRQRALARLDAVFGGESASSALLRALLLGDSSRLADTWKEPFRLTSTYHALVISGLHLTVLAGLVHLALRLAGLPFWAKVLLTAASAWLYAVLTGANTPVVRAAAGLTLYLATGWFFRRRRLLNVLGAVALAFLLIDPDNLFDASFHLSFLAVALIGAFAAPWLDATAGVYARALRDLSDRERDLHLEPPAAAFRVELRLLAETLHSWTAIPERWILAAGAVLLRLALYLWELIAVSAVVQVGLALPMVVYFHRVSWTGLLANPPVVALMSLAVQVGSIALLTGSGLLAGTAAWLVQAALGVARWFAAWEAPWCIPSPPAWVAVSLGAALVASAILFRRGGVFARLAPWPALGLLALVLTHPFPPRIPRGELEVTAIDVGQAECLFVALPGGQTMVVDGGGIPSTGAQARGIDIGEDVVSPYLWSRSIRKVDVLVSTHGHEDHIGGLPALLDNFRPDSLWLSAAAADPATEELASRARRRGTTVVRLAAGRRFEFGGAQIQVLAPPADAPPSPVGANNDSLVLRIRYGQRSVLLTGDAEAASEQAMAGALERTDILKAGHHGSATSTTPALLEPLRPAVVLISVGFDNSYRFPDRRVLDRLGAAGAAVYRTDLHGLITVRTDGRRVGVAPYVWR